MIKKNNQTQTASYFCILCILFCPFVLRLIGTQDFLSSTASIIIISICWTICWALNFKETTKIAELIIFIINCLFLILSMLRNGSLGVVITYYNIMVGLMVLNNISFSSRQIKTIRFFEVFLLTSLLLSFSYTWQYGSIWVYDGDNHINSNTYGILLLLLYLNIMCLIDSFTLKVRKKIILLVVLTIVAIYYIGQSGCRSAIIAVLTFFVLNIYKQYKYKKFLLFFVIMGLTLPVIYISMYEILGNVEFLGKNLFSGRQMLWRNTWNAIKEALFLGSGTTEKIQIGNGLATDSTHNVYLAFWKTIGIVPLISFIWLLFRGKNTNWALYNNSVNRKAFLSCMIICMVETLLNDNNYNYLVMLFLMEAEGKVSSGGNNNDT